MKNKSKIYVLITFLSLYLIGGCGPMSTRSGDDGSFSRFSILADGTDCGNLYNVGMAYTNLPPSLFIERYGTKPRRRVNNEFNLTYEDWTNKLGLFICVHGDNDFQPEPVPELSPGMKEQFDFFNLPYPEVVPLFDNPDGKGWRESYYARGIFEGPDGNIVVNKRRLEALNLGLGHFIADWQRDIMEAGYELPGECHGFVSYECNFLNALKHGIPL